MSRSDQLRVFEWDKETRFYLDVYDEFCPFEAVVDKDDAAGIIRDLEAELDRKDARIAELESFTRALNDEKNVIGFCEERDAALAHAEKAERERDEARVDVIDLRLLKLKAQTRDSAVIIDEARRIADEEWGPGTGAHLFPEES